MFKKFAFFSFLLVSGLTFYTGCNNKIHEKKMDDLVVPSTITVSGNKFVDNNGRQVILNGYNIVSKSKEEGYIPVRDAEVYKELKNAGVNCIRFVIIWDGLEPEPGEYNEVYLKEIDQQIKWAGQNDIFVVLDMHQDLFSIKYSDGAPEWATLDEKKPHEKGAIWSDAYMISPAVQTAFDNFWKNAKAPDGIGIQDHYSAVWKHVAQRYANNPTVIGYDLMNEPFPGSTAQLAMPALLKAYGELICAESGKILSENELAETWGDENKRLEALKNFASKEKYPKVIDALFAVNSEFEKGYLQQMYQKVSSSIRSVDTTHVIFLEHSYFSNTGVKSSIERVTLANGSPDPLVAYAPHGYDLVTDTKDVAAASSERVNVIFDRMKETGERLNMPVWIGEWGAYYGDSEGIVPTAQYAVGLIENSLSGNAFWAYGKGIEKSNFYKKALLRPYPSCINGELKSYRYDHQTCELTVTWEENPSSKAPTVIFVPWISRLKENILLKPESEKIETQLYEKTDAGLVIIHPSGKDGLRKIILQFETEGNSSYSIQSNK